LSSYVFYGRAADLAFFGSGFLVSAMSKVGNYSSVFFILPFGTNSAAALLSTVVVEGPLLSVG
jgi:hypothetical protein